MTTSVPGAKAGKADPSSETIFSADEGPRADSTAEALAKLKPAFHAQGTVTAGNSSQTSDGAAAAVLMEAGRAKELGIQPIARLVAYAVTGCLPEEMGIGPVTAIPKALNRAGLTLNDIGLIELNEAFAAQVLAVMRDAWARSGARECERRRHCAGASAGLHGGQADGNAAGGDAAAEGALRNGDHVRGRRHGGCGDFRAAGLETLDSAAHAATKTETAGIAPGCSSSSIELGGPCRTARATPWRWPGP